MSTDARRHDFLRRTWRDDIEMQQFDLRGQNVSCHECALAGTAGEATFFVHADRSMNSLVPADEAVLRRTFNTYDVSATSERRVRTCRLDDVLSDELANDSRFFLKIDTQGNEQSVIAGAPGVLERTDICLVEFMFCTPYRTEYGFRDLIDQMDDAGLQCKGPLHAFRRATHEISGVDFLFVRMSGN